MQSHKMNMEEIKQLLREEQIRSIVKESTTFWNANRISLKDPDRSWSHYVRFRGFYKKSGWSYTTFKKRWEVLINEGFIERSYFHTCCGVVETKEWNDKVLNLAFKSLSKQGLSRDLQSEDLFPDLKEIQEFAVREVLNALTPMGA